MPPVLIVGGGVVGLSASLFLAKHGISSLVVERHAGTCIHPRARGFNTRTMELMRELGLEEQIREAGAASKPSWGVLSGPTLVQALGWRRKLWKISVASVALGTVGGLLAGLVWTCTRFVSWEIVAASFVGIGTIAAVAAGGNRWLRRGRRHHRGGDGIKASTAKTTRGTKSPAEFCRCPQDLLEPVLLKAALETQGWKDLVRVQFRTEVTAIRQDPVNGVTATLVNRDTGVTTDVRCEYAVGADGAKSTIRRLLAIPFDGPGELTPHVNIYFEADLSPLVSNGNEFSMAIVQNEHVRGLFASINNSTLWVLHVAANYGDAVDAMAAFHEQQQHQQQQQQGAVEEKGDCGHQRWEALVRAAIGPTPHEFTVRIIGALPWSSTVRMAEHTQDGRIFLCGDSAHVMPPWGGFGANTGIQDAHNLAWKLAAVLKGHARPSLLATYEKERLPVAKEVSALAQAMNDKRGLLNTRLTPGIVMAIIKSLSFVVVGYAYGGEGTAIAAKGLKRTGRCSDLSGRPGTRIPHVYVTPITTTSTNTETETAPVSTVDFHAGELVLWAGPDADVWCDAAATHVARQYAVPLRVLRQRVDFVTTTTNGGDICKAFGIKKDGVLLVRPDGFVAWRSSDTKVADAAKAMTLSNVLGALHFTTRAP